jgi:hypothetical protein
LPWAKNVPVLGEELSAHLEVQQVISQREPDTLCNDLEPEFHTILTYIQSCSSKKRPDYKYIKKNLHAIKERNNFTGTLEWYKPELAAASGLRQQDRDINLMGQQTNTQTLNQIHNN